MNKPGPRVGWELRREPSPSLVQHWLPIGVHRLSNQCWCKPAIQSEQNYTIVHHNDVLPSEVA